MARYKVGDKVRMIDKFVQDEIYYMRSQGNKAGVSLGVSLTIKWSLQDRMRLAGKIVTISEVRDYYRIKEDGRRKLWTDDMFVGLADDGECYCESLL